MNRSNGDYTIRTAAPGDAWAVGQLFAALHAYNSALDGRFALAEGWEHVLHDHLWHVEETGLGLTVLAWRGAQPVGLVMMGAHTDTPLFRHRRWAELLALYIDPALRGAGLAEQLLARGADWAHAQGYERIQLYVTAANQRAKRFYARCGFRPVQEIWRRELGAADHAPPDDPVSEAHFAQGDDLLAIHPHLLGGEEGGAEQR